MYLKEQTVVCKRKKCFRFSLMLRFCFFSQKFIPFSSFFSHSYILQFSSILCCVGAVWVFFVVCLLRPIFCFRDLGFIDLVSEKWANYRNQDLLNDQAWWSQKVWFFPFIVPYSLFFCVINFCHSFNLLLFIIVILKMLISHSMIYTCRFYLFYLSSLLHYHFSRFWK